MNVAVIAGATGAVAQRLVEHLDASGWEVVGLCRRPAAAHGRVRYLGVDLLDGPAVAKALQGVPEGNSRVLLGAGQVRRRRRRERGRQRRHAAQRAGCGRGELRRASRMCISSRAASGTASTSAPIRRRPRRTTSGTCRPTSTTTRRTCCAAASRASAGRGRRRAPTSSATSRRGARATSSRSSAPMPRSAASSACGWIFRAIRTSSAR